MFLPSHLYTGSGSDQGSTSSATLDRAMFEFFKKGDPTLFLVNY